jgi:hypothetical protein
MKVLSFVIVLTLLVTGSSCLAAQANGGIFIYGEVHGVEKVLERELEIWQEHYGNEGMRHLFIEFPHYTAALLNNWMKAENDTILDVLYDDWKGTASHVPQVKAFYQAIKKACPETVFHGVDVGHQYDTTGTRYLNHLAANGEKGSAQYLQAQEVVEQGKHYYESRDEVYRENKMAENFIREVDALKGESLMGIFGNAHTGLDAMDYVTNSVPCMANQLQTHYGDRIHSEDLSWLAKAIEPERTDMMKVGEKEYEALYFGKQDLGGFKDYAYREFWRLENAYDDFKEKAKNNNVLPYDNYPMLIEQGQVFAIDYTKRDASVARIYYRADGNEWNGWPITEEFLP